MEISIIKVTGFPNRNLLNGPAYHGIDFFCCPLNDGFPSFVPLSAFQDPFIAFHLDKALVRKYMNPLLIGELAPDQPSFEPSKNVSVIRTWFWG